GSPAWCPSWASDDRTEDASPPPVGGEAQAPEATEARSDRRLETAPTYLHAGPRRLHARRARRHLRPPRVGPPPRPDERAGPHDPDPEHRRHERRGRVRAAPCVLPVGPPT